MVTTAGYKIKAILHENEFYRFHRATRLLDEQSVVLKTIHLPSRHHLSQVLLQIEFNLLQNIDTEFSLTPLCLESFENNTAAVYESIEGYELTSLIPEQGMEPSLFLKLALKITATLRSLHRLQLFCFNIQPANIFINSESEDILLLDFTSVCAFSQCFIRNDDALYAKNPVFFQAPECRALPERLIDWRIDIYSLGLTFYQMITGTAPYSYSLLKDRVPDRQPLVSPIKYNPDIPEALSDVIMMCLDPNPEERYQSAQALLNDLEECRKRIGKHGKIEFFFPGSNNIREHFHIPKKLYGRENELDSLNRILNRVAETGINEFIFLSGDQGIGKTAIIDAAMQPSSEQAPGIIGCQFSEDSQSIPYSGLIKALRELTQRILQNNERRTAFWQRALQSELGANANVLTEFIPELRIVLEEHRQAQQLTPEELRNRLNLVLMQFIRTLSSAEYPLVLILDNLQWADPSSIKLVELLLSNPDIQYLCVISSLRSDEADRNMYLQKLIGSVQESGPAYSEIKLDTISRHDVERICADTLCCPLDKIQPVSDLVFEQSQGNPYLLHQVLAYFYESGIIWFAPEKSQWMWKAQDLHNRNSSRAAHTLISQKLLHLDSGSQRLVWVAACMGYEFDIQSLKQAGYKQSELSSLLAKLVQKGLIIPEFKYAIHNHPQSLQLTEEIKKEWEDNYAFVFKDKMVQKVAGSYMGNGQRAMLHLETGRNILQNKVCEASGINEFIVANHFNSAKDVISDFDELLETVKLNLAAGLKAKAMASYDISAHYFKLGIDVLRAAYPDFESFEDLSAKLWETSYDLLSSLVKEKAESEFLTGQFEESLSTFNYLLAQVRSPLEKATAYSFLTALHTASGRNKEAIKTGLKGLELLGIKISKKPSKLRLFAALLLALWKQRRFAHGSRINFKESDLSNHNTVFKLFMNLHPAAYFANRQLLIFLILKLFILSLRFGNKSHAISLTHQGFGFLISFSLNKYRQGYHLAKTGIDIAEKQNHDKLIGLNFFIFGSLINNWTQPVSMANGYLGMAFKKLNECGSLVYAGYAAVTLVFNLSQTEPLLSLSSKIDECLLFARKTKDKDVESALVITRQFTEALQGKTSAPTSLSNAEVDENSLLKTLEQNDQPIPSLWYALKKAQLHFLFEEYAAATEAIESVYKSIKYSVGLSFLPDYYYLYFLLLISRINSDHQKPSRKQVKSIKNFLGKMKIWSQTCPENHRHKYLLMKAEYLGFKNKQQAAKSAFMEAIQTAFDDGFIMHAGVACERMAAFCMNSGLQTLAMFFFEKAQNAYFNWGATTKVTHLSQKISRLEIGHQNPKANRVSYTGSHDLSTIIKTSQVIGSEIVLDRLQKTLMQTMIENSGANKGFLVLKKDKDWMVEAEGDLEREKKISLKSYQLDFNERNETPLPLSVIQYVEQTRQSLVIKNATSEKTFSKDSYILNLKPKSVFCSPIIHQGKLIGIFYLENNHKAGVFTPQRLEILELFASQAAISLENAWLYADQRAANEQLQREINERQEIENELLFINEELERSNQELLETQSQLIQSAKLASIGELATGMAHELNQPLMYIRNSAQLSLMEGAENMEKNSVTELLRDIEKSTGSMMSIINHLRDFARHHELNLFPIDVHDVLDDSLILISEQLRIRSIELEKRYGEEIPNILGNSQQLEQVFINILTNARDAMEGQANAQLKIKTSFLQLTEFKGELTVAFEDNGAGISEEDQQKLFDPFFTTKEAGKGTGLGLSISYGIIRDHGGRILVENNQQAGVTFRVILPVDLREVEPEMNR